jgi:hypothetical protein
MERENALATTLAELPTLRIFEASKLYAEKLNNKMTEVAYYKALERLTKENYLAKVSKGVYCRPQKTKYGLILPSESSIVAEYVNDNKGIVVGYTLYNKLNISTQISKQVKVYSNAITQRTKTIGNIYIERKPLEFTKEVCTAIELLEVLSNYYSIQDFNYKCFITLCEQFSKDYNEEVTEKVLAAINYSKSTIAFLISVLNYYNVGNSLGKYLSALSTYKYPSMEEIYELARI